MAPPHFRHLALTGLLCLSAAFAPATEPEWPEWRKPLIDGFVNQLKEVDGALEKHPDSPMFRSRHGDLCLFLGFFPQAVADFEKFHAMDPSQESSRWRLGIAYYFAGEYVKSEQTFEKYYEFDSHDRENGIWKFLAQEKVKGIKTAQEDMLVYKEFDREPFPILYEMYAGKKTPDEVLDDLRTRGLDKDPQVMFFANYYVGLYEKLLGHPVRAVELLKRAVDIKPGPDTVYMWNVARLQWERLARDQASGK